MFSHTAAPWEARKGDTFNPDRPWGIVKVLPESECEAIDGDTQRHGTLTEVIAEVCSAPGNIAEGDARLMAASPRMYELLKEIRDTGVFECCCGQTPCCGTCTATEITNLIKYVEGI